jgi:hypothetical protein
MGIELLDFEAEVDRNMSAIDVSSQLWSFIGDRSLGKLGSKG